MPPANPFAYDVSRFSKTDANLLQFERVRQFMPPHPEVLQRMVACHVAFGRDHATGQCPLHVAGVQAAMRVSAQGVSLTITARDSSQTAELQRRARQVIKVAR